MNSNVRALIYGDAWIFLAVACAAPQETAPLSDIIGAADFINHAIPTEQEMTEGLTSLLQAGLIHINDDRSFGLTPAGVKLAKQCRKKSAYWLDQWLDYLGPLFRDEHFPKVSDQQVEFSTDEYQNAFKAYSREFSIAYREILRDERDSKRKKRKKV